MNSCWNNKTVNSSWCDAPIPCGKNTNCYKTVLQLKLNEVSKKLALKEELLARKGAIASPWASYKRSLEDKLGKLQQHYYKRKAEGCNTTPLEEEFILLDLEAQELEAKKVEMTHFIEGLQCSVKSLKEEKMVLQTLLKNIRL